MCQLFKVSTSGYYNWLKGMVSKRWLLNEKLIVLIKDIFKNSFESYGAPRIKVALKDLGFQISKPKIAKIMRAFNCNHRLI